MISVKTKLNEKSNCSVMHFRPMLYYMEAQYLKDKIMRIALFGIQEEVNTFASETIGLRKVTGNMATASELGVMNFILRF